MGTPIDSNAETTLQPNRPAPNTEKPSAETIEQTELLWSESITQDLTPGMTIKPSRAGEIGLSRLSVKPHTLTESASAVEPTTDYEILEVLGEGGMGVVLTARQTSIDREVAVKMIRGAAAVDELHQGKFLSEAAVTGGLDHPNIVPIYDLGANQEGALFYSMKRVHGTPWSEVIEEKTRTDNLEILMRVADAVAFAHAKGVIHRDLKPENVMLGEFGEVLVMDWGLAVAFTPEGKGEKLVVDTPRAGTPAYMAPEMASDCKGPMGIWSDVYLLGGMLYEIVTGLTPHTGDSVKQCMYNVFENRLQKSEEQGELVDVALKAMATDPKDRYASVKAFQDGIRLYLSHMESIHQADQAGEDLMLAKQKRTEVASGQELHGYGRHATAMLGFKRALELWSENQVAQAGYDAARMEYAEFALERGDYDLAESLLKDENEGHAALLETIRKARQSRLLHKKQTQQLMLVTGLLVVAVIVGIGTSYYKIREQRNKTSAALGKVKEERDKVRVEKQQTQKALLQVKAEQMRAADEADRAEKEARRSRTVSTFLTSMLAMADPTRRGGRNVTVLDVVDAMSEEVDKKFGDDDSTRQGLNDSIGRVYLGLGRYEEASRHLKRASDLTKTLHGEAHPHYAKSLNVLALLYRSQGELAKAESLFLEAMTIWKKTQGEGHYDYAASLNNLAGLYKEQGAYTKAVPLYREAIDLVKKAFGVDHADYARSLHNLAEVYRHQKNYAQAEPLYQEAIAALKRAVGEDHPHYAMSLHNLAEAYLAQGAHAKCEPLFRQTVTILRKALGEAHPHYAISIESLGRLHQAQGDYAKVEPLFREALAIRKKTLGENHPSYATGLKNLGMLFFEQNRLDEAQPPLIQALAIFTKRLGKDHPNTKDVERDLRLVRQKRRGGAE